MAGTEAIRTPDQRLRVFVSSTLEELAAERRAVRDAVTGLHLVPVMFELGARPHPARDVYRAYLKQSQVFLGIYWQRYGWVAPGAETSGLEEEYLLSAGLPRLIYVKSPAPDREPRLGEMLDRMRNEGDVSYQRFTDASELRRLVEDDLAVLLSERFEMAGQADGGTTEADDLLLTGALPVPATPLIGRDQEADGLIELVVSGGARLLTLTGPGGVGKSRLALEVARRLLPGFAGEVRFADLTALTDADLVPAAIAGSLGLSSSGGSARGDLRSFLRDRRLLLVLDNFEQVLDAAPVVSELLGVAPGLVAVVTSRTVLRLSGEHEFPVLPLPVPPLDGGGVADRRQNPALRLFEDRAKAGTAGFELTDGNVNDVTEICRRLDGLPLAIELAAARVKLLPPSALLARLDEPFGLLTGGRRDVPERQRTLRNTLDWSFGLLAEREQALFASLGVFVGSFALPAVEAVGGDADGQPQGYQQSDSLIDALGSLVDNSLVRATNTADEPRYVLLETIREYALDRLRASGQWNDVHDRHAAYFVALAEPGADELFDPGQLRWLRRLETEHGNLGAAVVWMIDRGRLDPVVRFSWATWRFWWFRGHAEEAASHTSLLLAKSDNLPPAEHAAALGGAGLDRLAIGDQTGARALLEQSVPLFRAVGDKLRLAIVTSVLGHIAAEQGRLSDASELLEASQADLASVEHVEFTGEDRLQQLLDVAAVHTFLGQIRLTQGDLDGAAQQFEASLEAARTGPHRFALLISLYDVALGGTARGDANGAAEYLREGLSLANEAGDESTAAYYLEALAAVARMRGDLRRAARLVAAARALLRSRGSGWLHIYVPRLPHGDEELADLRSAMHAAAIDETEFDEAVAWGDMASAGRAVEYALAPAPVA